jgi:hypothetical protein
MRRAGVHLILCASVFCAGCDGSFYPQLDGTGVKTSGGAAQVVESGPRYTVRLHRTTPAGRCSDSELSTRTELHEQREIIEPEALRGQRAAIDSVRIDALAGVDCTLRSNGRRPIEYEFTVRRATRTTDGVEQVVFAPQSVIRVTLGEEGEESDTEITVNEQRATDFERSFIARFLMTERGDGDVSIRDEALPVGEMFDTTGRIEALLPFTANDEPARLTLAGRAGLERLVMLGRAPAYELHWHARSGDIRRRSGEDEHVLTAMRDVRIVHPVQLEENERSRQSITEWSMRGTQTESGVRFRFTWRRRAQQSFLNSNFFESRSTAFRATPTW